MGFLKNKIQSNGGIFPTYRRDSKLVRLHYELTRSPVLFYFGGHEEPSNIVVELVDGYRCVQSMGVFSIRNFATPVANRSDMNSSLHGNQGMVMIVSSCLFFHGCYHCDL